MWTKNKIIDLFTKNNCVKYFNIKSSDNDLPSFLSHAIEKSNLSDELLFMELGVFTGNTFMMLRSELPENIILYGFDTFKGLPEDWISDDNSIIYPRGAFAIDYIPEETINTKFIVGKVEETLGSFMAGRKNKVSFVHFDMDLYNPTYYSLQKLYPQFIVGTVLVFDDFFNLPGWQNHSFKALIDFLNDHNNIQIKPICTVGWESGWASVAIQITNI